MTGKSQKFRDSRMTDEGKEIYLASVAGLFGFLCRFPVISHMQTVTKGAQTRDFNHKHVISELL
jgi:hypothetical protein